MSDLPNIEFCSIIDFAECDYSIVGDGGYVVSLLDLIKRTHGNMPQCIYVNKHTALLPEALQVLESKIHSFQNENLILGTNLFQLEMLKRLAPKLHYSSNVYDVAAAKGNADTIELFLSDAPKEQPYVLFIGVNPTDNLNNYLCNFIDWLAKEGVQLVVRHPLQDIDESIISAAVGIFIWNGAMPIHQPFLKKCEELKINVTYIECGFFPQSQYFYFDRCGVNNESQLYDDDLNWVNSDMLSKVEMVRTNYFSNKNDESLEHRDYVFVPLQVPTDSNILNHSRFTNGMQEFIDFIESSYSNKLIVFKPHPKDRLKDTYQYQHGKVSSASIFTLISHSKMVHGINTSVLYEAVLMNKPVKVEGDCLLAEHNKQPERLLAAMCFRQFSIEDKHFCIEKMMQFSFLNVSKMLRHD